MPHSSLPVGWSFSDGQAFQTAFGDSFGNAFVTKLSTTGNTLVYSTYLGGSGTEEGHGIAIDDSGNAYVIGETVSADFPTTPGAFDQTCGTDGNCNVASGRVFPDAFVTKLNVAGSALVYSIYLGGSDNEVCPCGIAVDSAGNVYVTGRSLSSNFPTTLEAFDRTCGTDGDCNKSANPPFSDFLYDAFVTKLNPTGDALVYSTYLGGSDNDEGNGIAVDGSGDAYVTGITGSTDFPTANPLQPSPGGGIDAFVAKIGEPGPAIQKQYFAQFGNGANLVSSIVLTNPSSRTASGAINFLNDQGLPLSVSLNGQPSASSVSFSIQPLGSATFTTDGEGDLVAGSAGVRANIPVAGVVRFSFPGLGIAGVGESVPLGALMTPVGRDAARGLNTGIAIRNTQAAPVQLTLSLRGLDGLEVSGGSTSQDLPANGHLAKFVDELFPNANTANFEGTLIVLATTSGGEIAATAIQLGSSPGEFTTLPVVPVDPAPTDEELYFAQFGNGSELTSSLFLVNPSLELAISGEM